MNRVEGLAEESSTPDYWDGRWKKVKYRLQRRWGIYGAAIEEIEKADLGEHPVVADVGCGIGGFMERLKEIDGAMAFGIDHSAVALEHCKFRGMTRVRADAARFPIDGDLDLIVAINTLEYLGDPVAALKHWKDKSKNLILIVPQPTGKESNGEAWFWDSEDELIDDVADVGFKVVSAKTVVLPDGNQTVVVAKR